VVTGWCFIFFRLKDHWRQPHLLDGAQKKASRNPGEECGEQDPPDHDCRLFSVTGKADGVPGIMSRIVHADVLRKADTVEQRRPKKERSKPSGNSLRETERSRQLMSGHGHPPCDLVNWALARRRVRQVS
jgi:hypothetical protein